MKLEKFYNVCFGLMGNKSDAAVKKLYETGYMDRLKRFHVDYQSAVFLQFMILGWSNRDLGNEYKSSLRSL